MNEIVQITSLGFGGAFVGTVIGNSTRAGKKAFVREVLPGEVVEVEIQTEVKNYLEGRVLRIIESSGERTTPPCPKFGSCGGCDLQHISIGAQRIAKLKMVEDSLLVQGGIKPIEGVKLIGEDLPAFNYRKRVSLHLNKNGELGFYRIKSGEVIQIEICLIASERINKAIHDFSPFVSNLCSEIGGVAFDEIGDEIFCMLKTREGVKRKTFLKSESFLQLLKKVPNVVVEHREKVLFAQYRFSEIQPNENHFSYVGRFSQVNDTGNKVLIENVLRNIQGSKVTEFFAGSGNFSLPLASEGKTVQAVEVDPSLVELGRERAREKNLSEGLYFHISSAEKFIKNFAIDSSILLDPPRGGAKTLIDNWDFSRINEIVYVSCNLPTLTRDLKLLKGQGFELLRVFVLDMFPQTHHVETLSVLTARHT